MRGLSTSIIVIAVLLAGVTFAQSTKEYKVRGYKSEAAMIAHAKDRCPKIRALVLKGQCIGVSGCDQYGGPTEQEVATACQPQLPAIQLVPPPQKK